MKLTDIITNPTIKSCVRGETPIQTADFADCELDTIKDDDGIEIYNLIHDSKVVGSIEDDGNGFSFSDSNGNMSALLDD